MKKTALWAVVPIAIGAAGPAFADHKPGHAPGPDGALSLRATDPFVRYNPFLEPPGGVAALTGRLTGADNAGRVIALEQNPAPLADNLFEPTAREATTDAQGRFSFTGVVIPVNTQFRARRTQAPVVVSDPATVRVRLRVSFGVSDRTPSRGERVRFSGRIWPEHDGQPVAIQRRSDDGRFRTIKRTVARDVAGREYSRYRTRLRVRRTGVYRVVARSGDADHASGISRKRRLVVG